MLFSTHVNRFNKHHDLLNNFFSTSNKLQHLQNPSKDLIEGLHSAVHVIPEYLKSNHPNEYKKLINLHGHHLHNIANAKTLDSRHRHLLNAEYNGGSIFSHIGHFFKHAAHAVSHVAKQAVHGVVKGAEAVGHEAVVVGKDVAKGVKTAVNTVEGALSSLGNDIKGVAQDTVDYIKSNIQQLGKDALPYLEKAVNLLVSEIPAVGPVIAQGLMVGEQVANPYIKQAIGTKGSGLRIRKHRKQLQHRNMEYRKVNAQEIKKEIDELNKKRVESAIYKKKEQKYLKEKDDKIKKDAEKRNEMQRKFEEHRDMLLPRGVLLI